MQLSNPQDLKTFTPHSWYITGAPRSKRKHAVERIWTAEVVNVSAATLMVWGDRLYVPQVMAVIRMTFDAADAFLVSITRRILLWVFLLGYGLLAFYSVRLAQDSI